MSNVCPEFSGSSRGFDASLVISLIESKLSQGMVLPHTRRTRGSTKHDKLHALWKRSMWWIWWQWYISSLVLFSSCDFTFSEDLKIFLIPAHILNFFSRPCSNMCITYILMHSYIYIYAHIYTDSKYGFRRKKLVTCMGIFLLSHRFVNQSEYWSLLPIWYAGCCIQGRRQYWSLKQLTNC